MSAQRRNAGALAPDVAAEHQQIGNLLHIACTVAMLGDPHPVVEDDALRLGIDVGGGLDVRSRQPGSFLDRIPGGRVEVRQQLIESGRVICNEFAVENTRSAFGKAFGIKRHEALHDTFQHRDVAADLHQIIGRSDRRRTQGQHLDRVLRRGEPLQPALAQRVEDDDRHPSLGHLAQRGQHAWVIGPGIVADAKDRVAMVEILERHGSLADADRFRQADACCLMTHV